MTTGTLISRLPPVPADPEKQGESGDADLSRAPWGVRGWPSFVVVGFARFLLWR